MEQPSAVVKYKKLILGGLMGTAFVAVQLVVYIYLNDVFVNKIVLPIAMALEMAINVWMFLKGLREDHLDERGITVKTPFGTKYHPWAAVESYGIEVVQTRRDRVPRICLQLREERKQIVIAYQEDAVRCLRHYRGLPAYNKWEEESRQ